MTAALTDEEIAARIEAARNQAAPTKTLYRYVRPLTEAAESLIEYVTNPEGRFYLGLAEIDMAIRGFGRGELAYVTGRAHSGKTQLILNGINNNADKRILFFTPDEPKELVLSKLVSLWAGVNAEEVEEGIRQQDKRTLDLVRSAASERFPNLYVIDDALTLGQMADALKEAEDSWGDRAELAVIDFLELVPGESDDRQAVEHKSQALKRWVKDCNVPTLCLHQASRGSGGHGQALGMDALRYGGENDAIYVLAVWRKKDDPSLDAWQRQQHETTITVGVVKNKRPPCRRPTHDFWFDPLTGRICDAPPAPCDRSEQPEIELPWWQS